MADEFETDEATKETEAGEVPAESAARKRPVLPVVIIAAVLLLPLIYLFVTSTGPKAASTAQAPAAPQGPDVPALEEAVRASPTIANELNLSVGYINKNQLGQAGGLLKAIVAKDPQNAIAWNNLCTVHIMQQDLATAMKDCAKAIAAEPTLQIAKNNMQWALGEQKKAVDAIAADERTAPADRTEALYLREGLNQLHIGDYPAAIRSFTAGLELNPKSSADANNIGIAYMMESQYREAEPWFQKAVALDPSSQLSHNNLAWANSELSKTPQ